jgi:hypothetical protein
MNSRMFTTSVLIASVLVPSGVFAAEQRRDYSEYWTLTSNAANKVEIVKDLPILEERVASAQERLDTVNEEYARLLEGLRYEKATLLRERESLESITLQNILIERDLLSQFTIEGAPSNHLKRWAVQRKLNNAKKIFEAERRVAFENLESRERLLARETEKTDRKYLAKRKDLQRKFARVSNDLEQQKNALNYAQSDRRNVFLDTITVTERGDFLQPRRNAYLQARARRAERLRMAVERAQQNNYLSSVQPIVVDSMRKEKQAEEEHERKLYEKEIIESLGSNLSSKEKKMFFLEQFLNSVQ